MNEDFKNLTCESCDEWINRLNIENANRPPYEKQFWDEMQKKKGDIFFCKKSGYFINKNDGVINTFPHCQFFSYNPFLTSIRKMLKNEE